MKRQSYRLLSFSTAIAIITSSCTAMDTSSTAPCLIQMPPEILEHILQFVVQDQPDALGNLAKIQEISKKLAGLLSKDEIKWILKLDQSSVNSIFHCAIDTVEPRNLQLLINLGAQFDKGTILFEVISHAMQVSQNSKGSYTRISKVIEILEQAGASWISADEQDYFFTQSIGRKAPLVAQVLLERGKTATDLDLTLAIKQSNLRIVEQLLKHRAPTIAQHLCLAVTQNNPGMVQLLVDSGIDVNLPDTAGNPALMYAKSPEVVTILLRAGAQLYVACQTGSTPFKELIKTARKQKNPTLLIELLKARYSLETATAIALALIAGASAASMVCTIL